MESAHERALDRLTELTQVGAARAAAAFGQLVGARVAAQRPVVREGGSLAARGAAFGPVDEEGAAGVFFEFEGCVDALVGILFPAAASERLVRSIVGIESGHLDPTIVESALMEVGNILASHVASGIADALHSRLLPSIPALARERAEVEFESWVERVVGEPTTRIEVALSLDSREVVGRLVVVPTRTPGDDGADAQRHAGPV